MCSGLELRSAGKPLADRAAFAMSFPSQAKKTPTTTSINGEADPRSFEPFRPRTWIRRLRRTTCPRNSDAGEIRLMIGLDKDFTTILRRRSHEAPTAFSGFGRAPSHAWLRGA